MATQVRLPAGPLLWELDAGPDLVTFACVCRREELCPNTSSSVFQIKTWNRRIAFHQLTRRKLISRKLRIRLTLRAWTASSGLFNVGGQDGQQESVFEHRERSTTSNDCQRSWRSPYKFPPKHAFAQLAAIGTFGNVFYATASDQLDQLRKLIDEVDDNEFLAKLAVYARERAYMKDMPAALLVTLSTRDTALMHKVFDRVADNCRVLRTVFQMVRSGLFGRKGCRLRFSARSSVG